MALNYGQAVVGILVVVGSNKLIMWFTARKPWILPAFQYWRGLQSLGFVGGKGRQTLELITLVLCI